MAQLVLTTGNHTFQADEVDGGWELQHIADTNQARRGRTTHMVATGLTHDGLADAVDEHLSAACPLWPHEYVRKGRGKVHRVQIVFDRESGQRRELGPGYTQHTACYKPITEMVPVPDPDLGAVCLYCGPGW